MSNFKKILLFFFNILILFILILKLLKILPSVKKNKPKVFFGGARVGNIGGTLTKIKKLKKYFGESLFGFNIVYLMSNTPYLNSLNLLLINKLKIPIIHNQNGLFYPSWYDGNCSIKNKQINKQYLKANYIFFQSNFCKEISYKFLDKPKCTNSILYNSVDTKFYHPKHSHKTKSKDFSFLITGKFHYKLKDSLILSILSIKNCNMEGYNFKLNIHGYLDYKLNKILNEKINELNLQNNIFINGPYNQENANKIYNNNDVFLFLIYKAPCSNSVLEALSSGLPIIYSNSGGTPELVGDAGIGLSVDDSYQKYLNPDIDEVQKAMVEIYKNYENKSKKARQRAVEYYNIDNWFETHLKTMRDLLNAK